MCLIIIIMFYLTPMPSIFLKNYTHYSFIPKNVIIKSVHYALSQSCIDIIEDQIVRIIPFSSLFSQGRIDSDVVPDIRIWNDFGCI